MTQELIAELREWINYDPETGLLTWKKPRRKIRVGRECGGFDAQGYRRLRLKGREHKAHRVAWALFYGQPPRIGIDHINRRKDDNRIANLREATPSDNSQNTVKLLTGESGVRGVRWLAHLAKWQAVIMAKRKVYSRVFAHKNDAAEWVKQKRKELHGEFAAQQ